MSKEVSPPPADYADWLTDIKARVEDAARILHLTPLLQRKPRALSGGQRQRVAMGRAIVRNPKVFLFDEPLSNLDAKLRVQMRTEIKKVHSTVKTTTVYVTHDQVEALTFADEVVVMKDGAVLQIGTPADLFERPARLRHGSADGRPGGACAEGRGSGPPPPGARGARRP